MWKDKVRQRYRWARIQDELDELLYELSKAEDEEEEFICADEEESDKFPTRETAENQR